MSGRGRLPVYPLILPPYWSAARAILMTALLVTVGLRFVIAQSARPANDLKTVTIADGVVLHYDERGQGAPIVFVHGSLADYSVWNRELADFSTQYRAISYSRRYNSPNTIRSGLVTQRFRMRTIWPRSSRH